MEKIFQCIGKKQELVAGSLFLLVMEARRIRNSRGR